MFSFKFDFDLTRAEWGVGGGLSLALFFLKILFSQVLLKLYAKFQPSTMSGSSQKVLLKTLKIN